MKHGTQHAYRAHQCRCPECQAWKAEDMKKYRRRRLGKGWKIRRGKWETVPD